MHRKGRILPSLNRTMQYGNTEHVISDISGNMFKSYYVVWKLQKYCKSALQQQKFKSYYVVWKP